MCKTSLIVFSSQGWGAHDIHVLKAGFSKTSSFLALTPPPSCAPSLLGDDFWQPSEGIKSVAKWPGWAGHGQILREVSRGRSANRSLAWDCEEGTDISHGSLVWFIRHVQSINVQMLVQGHQVGECQNSPSVQELWGELRGLRQPSQILTLSMGRHKCKAWKSLPVSYSMTCSFSICFSFSVPFFNPFILSSSAGRMPTVRILFP